MLKALTGDLGGQARLQRGHVQGLEGDFDYNEAMFEALVGNFGYNEGRVQGLGGRL